MPPNSRNGHDTGSSSDGRNRALGRVSRLRTTTAASVLVALVLTAGCGGSNSPGATGHGQNQMTKGLAYARCMRSHGVSDFPDPTAVSGGGVGFQINGGPGSDLDPNNPTYRAAHQACQSLLPGGDQSPPLSAKRLAAEVTWAHCMRSHGLPGFPDPNAQGAFDSSRFNHTSSAFRTASNDCMSLEPTGPISAVPGNGSRP